MKPRKRNMTETPDEQTSFTKEEMDKKIAEAVHNAQVAQFQADEMRIYGNEFFAESLDHMATLAQRDPHWAKVFTYGKIFRQQFELNTGQAQAQQPPKKEPEKEEKKK